MWISLQLYQLITLQLLFRFQKTKIASMVTVSGNSTVLCFGKYKIKKFTIKYSKKLAKEQKENKTLLENKLKKLKGNLNTEDSIQSYNTYKKELHSI